MFSRTRSIISFFTIWATMVFGLPASMTAQRSDSGASPSAPSAVLYSNANMQTGTGNGFNGANTSTIPAGSNSLGFNVNGTLAVPFHLGDRFTLTAASTISSIVFFSYSTSTYPNPPTTPFTGATVRIWNGRPGGGGTVVATSSTFGGSAWTGIYRVGPTTLTNAQRPVFSLQTDFPSTPLAAGHYWATISVTGIGAPGAVGSCFAPPVLNSNLTFPTAYPNGDTTIGSVQSADNQATWTTPVADGLSLQPVFIPIVVNGTAVTAAGVSVSGRVLSSAAGRGLTGAVVRLTDQNGGVRTVVTGRLGTFSFEDVEPGQTYVVSVVSRRFKFAPGVVQVADNVTDLEFAPE